VASTEKLLILILITVLDDHILPQSFLHVAYTCSWTDKVLKLMA